MIYLVVFVSMVVVLLICYMFPLALVCGNSMLPTLVDREVLIMRRVIRKKYIQEGKIYVYLHPYENKLVIKRLSEYLEGTKDCFFLGDNPTESYDSRDYGYIKAERIIAVLLWNSKYQLKSKGEKKNEKRN